MARTEVRANQVKDELVNADIAAGAAIAGTKINPNFGSQNAVTTGEIAAGTTTPSTDSRATGSVTSTASFFLGALEGDPSSPKEGQVWYNATDDQFKGAKGGGTIVILG